MKQRFVDLQDMVKKIPSLGVLIILGDFNACVGRRNPGMIFFWQETLGVQGLDERNVAGEEFLEVRASNSCQL